MSKHTPGKLEIIRTPFTTAIACEKRDKAGNRLFVGHMVDEGRELSAEEEDANADRIVACWNAMVGIDDPAAARALLEDPRVEAMTDMLQALKKAVRLARLDCANPDCQCVQCGVKREMLSAIAKGEGRGQ